MTLFMDSELDELRSATDLWARGAIGRDVDLSEHGEFVGFEERVDSLAVWTAQDFFATYLVQIGTVMIHGSLPRSFACARGAQALALTDELIRRPSQRLRDTMRFALAVLAPEPEEAALLRRVGRTNLHPGGSGARAVIGVRLGHQAARTVIDSEAPDRWAKKRSYFKEVDPDGPDLGEPVNQEDLLGMLLHLTVALFDGLERLGVPYSEADRQAWFTTWAIVARYLGIGTANAISDPYADPWQYETDYRSLFTLEPERSAEVARAIEQRHAFPSFEGELLTNVLLAELERPLSWGMKPFPRSLVRYLIDDELADVLGISPGGWAEHWLSQVRRTRRARRILARPHLGSIPRYFGYELSSHTTRSLLVSLRDQLRESEREPGWLLGRAPDDHTRPSAALRFPPGSLQ